MALNWIKQIKHTIASPRVYLLKWGITGWRLYTYMILLMLLIMCCTYTFLTWHQLPFIGSAEEYSSFYCVSPRQVHGKEGIIKATRGHNYRLKQVQAVIRHGDRSPIDPSAIPNAQPVNISCNFNSTDIEFETKLNGFKQKSNIFTVLKGDHPIVSERTTCKGGQLTPFGFVQHIFNGEHMRRVYSSLFSDAYSYKNVAVFSTDYDRTVQSASALLYGIFQDNFKTTDHSFPINIIKDYMDVAHFMMNQHGSVLECPKLLGELSKMKHNVELRAVNSIANKQIRRYAELFNADISLMPSISRMMDTLVTRLCHNQELPVGANGSIDKSLAEASFQLSHKYITAQHRPLSELQTTALLSKIVQNIVNTLEGKSSHSFVLYSGHDSTIAPLLLNLGASDEKWPPYASRVMIEVWELQSYKTPKNDGMETVAHKFHNKFIRLLYNGQVITKKVHFCSNIVDGELCPLEDLIAFVTSNDVNSGDYYKRITKLCNL